MNTFLFLVFALVACGGALAVVFSQNVVRMAFYLVISLGSTAGLYFLLNADFVGATQLLIYVGGTVVLLIFGVMLTASGPFLTIKSSPAEIVQAAIVGGLFLGLVCFTVLQVDWVGNSNKLESYTVEQQRGGSALAAADKAVGVRQIGAALLGVRVDKDVGSHRETLSTGYLLPFEIVSVHLLVVLIGAAYLARAKRRITPKSEGS
jgi:NADH:ubiquinone oxidoreductase subunit 6 (subunit J)